MRESARSHQAMRDARMSVMPQIAPPPQALGGSDFGLALAEGFARRIAALAERLGADAGSTAWARHAAFAASRATSAGHVCVPLARLAHGYGASEAEVRAALAASGVACDGMQDAAALRPLVVDSDGRLYLARYFAYERQLAAAIVAHGQSAHRFADVVRSGEADGAFADGGVGAEAEAAVRRHGGATLASRLARFFGPLAGDGLDWQRAAAALALSGRLTVVSGGPGTGKTTTVVGILACLVDADPTLSIGLAAPTGKAAQRMAEALAASAAKLPARIVARLPTGAQTLHRLLGVGQNGRPRHDRDNPLPFDVLVVDEASMIDVVLAAQLFDALEPATRLVMLGDKDQLAAVEAGAVFAELSARPRFSAAVIERMACAMDVEAARVAAALPGRIDADGLPPSDVEFDDEAWFAPGDEAERGRGDQRALGAAQLEDSMRADLDMAQVRSGDGLPLPGGAQRDERPAGHTRQICPDAAELIESEAPVVQPVDAAAPEQYRCAQPDLPFDTGMERQAPEPGPEPPAVLIDSVIWLERNYRFGLDSTIGRLSLAIRRGDAEAALAELGGVDEDGSSNVALLDEDTGATLAARTIERLGRGFASYATALAAALDEREPAPEPLVEALNAYRVLCATRRGARGVDALNAWMAAVVRRAARVPLAPGAVWFPGRPVMIARNDYALGLFNGDIGIALPGGGGALRVYFRTPEGGWRTVAPAALPPHDTAFALTVHKSQGSEFDEAALVLPSATSRVLSRELVYTALTRARRAVRIVGSRSVLATAIATPSRRDSGLAARMAEAGAAARVR